MCGGRERPFAMETPSWLTRISRRYGKDEASGLECYSLKELRRITKDFSEAHMIDKENFGKVYKATLPKGTEVIIKRSKTMLNREELLTFKEEMKLLSRVDHKNLVKLLGFCYEKKEEILVYEFFSSITLQDKLERDRRENRFDWIERLKIALDSASGLCYLHYGTNQAIIHRDIRPANILLDNTSTAKITGFGVSKMVPDPQKSYVLATKVVGSGVYLDPEYNTTKKLNKRSDVYGFGMVMLDLLGLDLTAVLVPKLRRSYEESKNRERGLGEIMELPLLSNHEQLPEFGAFIDLAINCINEKSDKRPKIDEVVSTLESIKNKASNVNSAQPSSSNLVGN